MNPFVRQLDRDFLLCLSSNAYYLNLIEGDQTVFRIDSEQKITFFKEIQSGKLFKNQVNKSKGKLIFVVNCRLEWSIFLVQKQNQPFSLLCGKIQSSSEQFPQQSSVINAEVVDIHQTFSRFFIVLSNQDIHELNISQKVKNQLQLSLAGNISNRSLGPTYVLSNNVYPLGSGQYLSKSYLPSPNTNIVTHALMVEFGNENDKNESKIIFIFVFRPKIVKTTLTESFDIYDSIYTIEFDNEEKKFLSGKQCVLNIPNKIKSLYPMGNRSSKVLIQTQQELYLWHVCLSQKNSPLLPFCQHKFLSYLTVFDNNSNSISYIGASLVQTQNSGISSPEIQFSQITESQSKGLSFQVIYKFSFSKIKPLLYFRNPVKQEDSYVFYDNYSVSKAKNFQKDLSEVAIFQDHSVFTDFAKVQSIEPMTNLLLVHKNTGLSSDKIVITNTFLQSQLKEYCHNIPLDNAKVQYKFLNKSHTIKLASPVIGTLFLRVQKQDQNKINFQTHDDFKPFTGYEILQISQTGKVIINSHQIIFSTEPNKQNKFPSLSISQIFEGSAECIEKAIIFDKSQFYLLSLDDQVHVFEGNSQKTFKRKFIHCFPSNVKSLIKLNDVNVFAVQLNQFHNQINEYQSDHHLYSFEIYVLREDKITLLNKVSYDRQFINFKSISFLSHINTVPHCFNFVKGKIIMVSSEQTHRYNPEKVTISIYDFPLPIKKKSLFTIIPMINLSTEIKTNTENQFFLQISEDCSKKVRFFIGSFPKKMLLKFFDEIKFNFEAIVLQSTSIEGQLLFSTVETESTNSLERRKKLMIYTQKKCYYFGLICGKISLSNQNRAFKIFVDNLFGLDMLKDFSQYQGLQKMKGSLKLCKKEISNLTKTKYGFLSDQIQNVLIYNKFQLWYANLDEKNKKISPISVYTMVNNDFLQFRNNLSVQEVDDPEFIKIFSLKLPIVQVKYLSDACIIVLFEKLIAVLEIGQNNCLTVRQQIIFNKAKQNEQDHPVQKEYNSIQIIELLDKASETDVFLKDAEGRLYIFSLNPKTQNYEINFDRILEEDIICMGRVKKWEQQKISISLIDTQKSKESKAHEQLTQQLIIKKDSQMILKDLITQKQKVQYI